jgi:8-oxo-dGTP diphosphatase
MATELITMEDKLIRIRACLAVIHEGRILLVPHYDTDAGPVQWNLPGGKVEFGESIQQCAIRELEEETGITAKIVRLLEVNEIIIPEKPWHSITISYLGEFTGGELKSEAGHPHGKKYPRWFTAEELHQVKYHPIPAINIAMGISLPAR